MEEISASIRESNWEAVTSTEPEYEETMSDGYWMTQSDQNADMDARVIPKSPWDMKKLQVQQKYNI